MPKVIEKMNREEREIKERNRQKELEEVNTKIKELQRQARYLRANVEFKRQQEQ